MTTSVGDLDFNSTAPTLQWTHVVQKQQLRNQRSQRLSPESRQIFRHMYLVGCNALEDELEETLTRLERRDVRRRQIKNGLLIQDWVVHAKPNQRLTIPSEFVKHVRIHYDMTSLYLMSFSALTPPDLRPLSHSHRSLKLTYHLITSSRPTRPTLSWGVYTKTLWNESTQRWIRLRVSSNRAVLPTNCYLNTGYPNTLLTYV